MASPEKTGTIHAVVVRRSAQRPADSFALPMPARAPKRRRLPARSQTGACRMTARAYVGRLIAQAPSRHVCFAQNRSAGAQRRFCATKTKGSGRISACHVTTGISVRAKETIQPDTIRNAMYYLLQTTTQSCRRQCLVVLDRVTKICR